MMAKAPAPEGVVWTAGQINDVPGWWCHPSDTVPGMLGMTRCCSMTRSAFMRLPTRHMDRPATFMFGKAWCTSFLTNITMLKAAPEALDGVGAFLRNALSAKRLA